MNPNFSNLEAPPPSHSMTLGGEAAALLYIVFFMVLWLFGTIYLFITSLPVSF